MQDKNFYRPTVFWSWNEGMLPSEIEEQVKGFAEQGIGGFFMHARAGLKIKYMGEEWMDAVQAAVDAGIKYGVDAWLYDEDGWPSGFAGGKVSGLGEEYNIKRMVKSETPLSGERLVAMYRKNGDGYALTEKASGACLYIYYRFDPLYVDLMNPDVTKEFIKCTHEVYKKRFGKYFGNAIKGIFTDEPQLTNTGFPYSTHIRAAFSKLKGYDMMPELWRLWFDCPESYKFRFDYIDTVSFLMKTSFSEPIGEWCKANNLFFTGHYAVEDSICWQTTCTGGVMAHYEYMQLPGIDVLARKLPPVTLMKQASSVRNQFGFDRLISESYGCSGWNLSFTQMAWSWADQASLGINLPCLHLAAYTIKGIRKRDYPPVFSYQEPWWGEFRCMSDWMARVNDYMSRGSSAADVLLVNGLTTTMGQYIAGEDQFNSTNQYRILNENLVSCQIDYDIGDEILLGKYGRVEDGRLALGNGRYGVVFVPESANIRESTVVLLEQLHRAGGKIIFVNTIPGRLDGVPDAPLRGRLAAIAYTKLHNRRDLFRKLFEMMSYERKVTLKAVTDYALAKGFTLGVRTDGGNITALAANSDTEAGKEVQCVFSGKGAVYEVLPDGGKKPLYTVTSAEKSFVRLSFMPMESRLLQFRAGEKSKAKPSAEDSCRRLTLSASALDKNCMTLDYAAYSFGGGYSDVRPVIWLCEDMYKLPELTDGGTLKLKYTFNAGYAAPDMTAAVEDADVRGIAVNGKPVKRIGWWMDKNIGEYDIAAAVNAGMNEVVLTYDIPAFKKPDNFEQLHESLKNRFFYPVEPEDIYIRGTFDVAAGGKIVADTNCVRVDNAGFTLRAPAKKSADKPFMSQGMWFYRGPIGYKGTFRGKADILRLDGMNAPVAAVYVNGKKAGNIFTPPYSLDISQYTVSGANSMEIVLSGTNRNLLGPLHHYRGEPVYTGPEMFAGKKGFGDLVFNHDAGEVTWRDSYHFVETGLGGAYIIKEKKLKQR